MHKAWSKSLVKGQSSNCLFLCIWAIVSYTVQRFFSWLNKVNRGTLWVILICCLHPTKEMICLQLKILYCTCWRKWLHICKSAFYINQTADLHKSWNLPLLWVILICCLLPFLYLVKEWFVCYFSYYISWRKWLHICKSAYLHKPNSWFA